MTLDQNGDRIDIHRTLLEDIKTHTRYVVTGMGIDGIPTIRRKGKYGDDVGPYMKFNPKKHVLSRG